MAFLDFIKNRDGQQPAGEQQSQQQQPETAKQMYTREAKEEQANAKPVDRDMKPEQRAVMSDVQEKMRGVDAPSNATAAPSPVPADSTTSPQPMAQKWENQDKAAPALSPTSMAAGARTSEQDVPPPANTPAPSQDHAKTIARTPPSWER